MAAAKTEAIAADTETAPASAIIAENTATATDVVTAVAFAVSAGVAVWLSIFDYLQTIQVFVGYMSCLFPGQNCWVGQQHVGGSSPCPGGPGR